MFYITRICHNTSNWQRPTGSATAEQGTFFSQHGYGHEEWLFRFEWQIAGWQYGFLQGVNRRRPSLLANRVKVADVVLFETPRQGVRRYATRIRNIEILDDSQAVDALAEYKKRGWYNRMLEEIDEVDGDRDAFGDAIRAPHVLNIRFRLEDVEWYPPDTLAQHGDPVLSYTRYTFIQLLTDTHFPETINRRRTRAAQRTPPIQDTYFRGGGSPRECSPEHGKIQQALYEELQLEYLPTSIVFEENFVDVTVQTEEETIFFEIKSDLNTRKALRLAFGQLLEYAYYWDVLPEKRIRLVAVGRTELTTEDERYLTYLTERFNLPFEYRQVKLPSET
ncbi:hypothetical protein R69658_07992 [Paraburkholderia aspalathi]|uniref:DUF3883 domain-containing protein n=1 Tax=Paraburkholderia aspalathi TaxID=1324617 RepID=A0ABN7NBR3_9BURK|nr:hypothetical protein [Paraburkholderia aspalathi]MBK3824228.1 hypothetical protein [Paraburkholderia aspalathi]MBK3836072.1 hypothetical protein [Paraburkholderia aspalathi]MBK3865834.1 hypothetical protein [Paraburkholderia aspalathi]CAE6868238.1 hypothetical protein R69658_07992 [Paraburkholderia aspalathi]